MGVALTGFGTIGSGALTRVIGSHKPRSIDDAIESGKPTVVAVGAPHFFELKSIAALLQKTRLQDRAALSVSITARFGKAIPILGRENPEIELLRRPTGSISFRKALSANAVCRNVAIGTGHAMLSTNSTSTTAWHSTGLT